MRNFLLILLIISFAGIAAQAQCIGEDKIKYGGDFQYIKYSYFRPHYKFSHGGTTAKKWKFFNKIDIRQVEAIFTPTRIVVEQKIKDYSGDAFFTRLKFDSVDILYPDSIEKFYAAFPSASSMAQSASCKYKYFFYYYFLADNKAGYRIGIAVDEQANIVSPFTFPSKKEYQPIDTLLTVCSVLEKVKRFGKQMKPVNEIRFDYNPETKQFYWLVNQGVVGEKAGFNRFNQIIIDAAHPSRMKVHEEQYLMVND